MQNLCRRRSSEDEETVSAGYSVAVTNSLCKDKSWVVTWRILKRENLMFVSEDEIPFFSNINI
jgi:hypothetical protein